MKQQRSLWVLYILSKKKLFDIWLDINYETLQYWEVLIIVCVAAKVQLVTFLVCLGRNWGFLVYIDTWWFQYLLLFVQNKSHCCTVLWIDHVFFFHIERQKCCIIFFFPHLVSLLFLLYNYYPCLKIQNTHAIVETPYYYMFTCCIKIQNILYKYLNL